MLPSGRSVGERAGDACVEEFVAERLDARDDLSSADGVFDAVEVQASGGEFVEVDGEVDRHQRVDEQVAAAGAPGEPDVSERAAGGGGDLSLDDVSIDPLPSYVWYQDMADFAERISDAAAGRRLARAIQGRGAFRRFKNELYEEYPHLLPAWHAFRDVRARRRAVEWLVDNSLVDEEAGARFVAEHRDPDLP
ncbi:UPF0158 family protein [Micromonospora sp. NPDC047620]|uniref:UPF0158 family protein n=1 Tax=Micromonospora sp. NPDC047620 TaxID=3364251 RepID=UPI0037119EE0